MIKPIPRPRLRRAARGSTEIWWINSQVHVAGLERPDGTRDTPAHLTIAREIHNDAPRQRSEPSTLINPLLARSALPTGPNGYTGWSRTAADRLGVIRRTLHARMMGAAVKLTQSS